MDTQKSRDVALMKYERAIKKLTKQITNGDISTIPKAVEQVEKTWEEFENAEMLLLVERGGEEDYVEKHQNDLDDREEKKDKTLLKAAGILKDDKARSTDEHNGREEEEEEVKLRPSQKMSKRGSPEKASKNRAKNKSNDEGSNDEDEEGKEDEQNLRTSQHVVVTKLVSTTSQKMNKRGSPQKVSKNRAKNKSNNEGSNDEDEEGKEDKPNLRTSQKMNKRSSPQMASKNRAKNKSNNEGSDDEDEGGKEDEQNLRTSQKMNKRGSPQKVSKKGANRKKNDVSSEDEEDTGEKEKTSRKKGLIGSVTSVVNGAREAVQNVGETISRTLGLIQVSKKQLDEYQLQLKDQLIGKWEEKSHAKVFKGVQIARYTEFLNNFQKSTGIDDKVRADFENMEFTDSLDDKVKTFTCEGTDTGGKYGMYLAIKRPDEVSESS